ncbi:MAG: OmpA family protein [Bacteroidia bacterium]
MKKIIQLIIIIFILSFKVSAQTSEQKWNLNIYAGKNDYIGSYTQSVRIFNSFFAINGVQYSRYYNPKFDWVINTNSGVWAFSPADNDYFITKGFREFSASARYRFKRLDVSKFSPFVSAGIGVRLFTTKINGSSNTISDATLPVSAGFDLKLGKKTALRYESIFGFTNKNVNDGNESTDNTIFGKDVYFQNNLGFVFYIDFKSKKIKEPKVKKVKAQKVIILDRDKDGIPDADDKCPDVMGIELFDGCPENDSDGDGVTNDKDNCPNIAGDPRFSGCLDSDNDGISDFHDKCPNLKGSLTTSGCPDTDGDGVTEDKDKCPTIAGLPINEGCPDSDNDGVPDHKDNCVLEPGTVELNGCPDRDKDGIGDKNDRCPDVFGVKELDGCPTVTVVPTRLKALVVASKKGIQFETGSAVLKPMSYNILNQISDELKTNKNLQFIIQGHTDNKGNAAKNLELSKNRAKAVANYLISKGIDIKRISSEGFGGSKPIAENKTEKGRALNRRVDLIIK